MIIMDDILLNLQILEIMSPALIIFGGYIYSVDSKERNFEYKIYKEAFNSYKTVRYGKFSYDRYVKNFKYSHNHLQLSGKNHAALESLYELLQYGQIIIEEYFNCETFDRQKFKTLVDKWNRYAIKRDKLENIDAKCNDESIYKNYKQKGLPKEKKMTLDHIIDIENIYRKNHVLDVCRFYVLEGYKKAKGLDIGLLYLALIHHGFIGKETDKKAFYNIILNTYDIDFAYSGFCNFTNKNGLSIANQSKLNELINKLAIDK